VVAWFGNYVPYKYDLANFMVINSVSFDHVVCFSNLSIKCSRTLHEKQPSKVKRINHVKSVTKFLDFTKSIFISMCRKLS
jgi:hypothetical protein